MSFNEVKYHELHNVEREEVFYAGGTFSIPAHHKFMGLIQLGVAGHHRTLVASFAERPTVSESGEQLVPVSDDYSIIAEVAHQPTPLVDTLRQVKDVLNPTVALLSNAEEIALKIKSILKSNMSAEDKLHAIYCPVHGVLAEAAEVNESWIETLREQNAASAADEDEDHDCEELPVDVLSAISAVLSGVGAHQATEGKPRIRIVASGNLADALEQLGLPTGKA